MQTPKARSSSEVPQKVPPQAVQQLKTSAADCSSASPSSQANRTPKERSPKVVERRSPRSPASEKKRTSRVSELESQVSQLQEDLTKTKGKLASSKSWKKQEQQEAEESQKKIAALSLKLEESQQQILALSSSREACVDKLSEISQYQKLTWESDLASAREEIERLKLELEMVAKSEAKQKKSAESMNTEIQSLKGNLVETLSLVENMKMELKDCKESETHAKGVVNETLQQLQAAKATVEGLMSEQMKSSEAYYSVVSDLEQSKTRVKLLEGLVSKLMADLSLNPQDHKNQELPNCGEANGLEEELNCLRLEVKRLRAELENTGRKHDDEKVKIMEELKNARELMEQMIFNSGLREAELTMELEKARAMMEELKASLIDKETELQGIVEENEGLSLKFEKNLSLERESKLERELKKLMKEFSDQKVRLMDKEMELQSVLEENESLKLEIGENAVKSNGELEAAREAEREAVVRVGILMEEVEKSKGRAARVAEQLDAAQATGAKLEAELRRLKVQSDQWRKAAEAAVAMLSLGTNGELMDQKGSLDSCYNLGRMGSPYGEDGDDDLMKKKNGNVLKKFGGLWKKPQK